jgi:hypothetical protein
VRIVGALDVHRSQITFKWHDMETGEVRRGRIAPVARESMRQWLARRRQAERAAPSGAPRPTVPTAITCPSCSSRVAYRRAGFRRSTSWSCGHR